MFTLRIGPNVGYFRNLPDYRLFVAAGEGNHGVLHKQSQLGNSVSIIIAVQTKVESIHVFKGIHPNDSYCTFSVGNLFIKTYLYINSL